MTYRRSPSASFGFAHATLSVRADQHAALPLTGVRRKINMSDDRILETRTESPAWTLPAVIVLGLIAIGGLAFGWNASSKLDSTQQAVAAQLKTAEQTMQQDM